MRIFLFLFFLLIGMRIEAWTVTPVENNPCVNWRFTIGYESEEDIEMQRHINAFVSLIPLDLQEVVRYKFLNAQLKVGVYNGEETVLREGFFEKLSKLTFLKELSIINCGLEMIPSEVFALENLEYLVLTDNKIKKIPSDIGRLTHLKSLYLNRNRLETLPEDTQCLSSIRCLYLRGNHLRRLPENISALTRLHNLALCPNPLTYFPRSLLQLAPRNRGNLDFLSLGTVDIVVEGDSLSLAEIREVFGEHVHHPSFDQPYEKAKEKTLQDVLDAYAQTAPRLVFDRLKHFKIGAVPQTTLTHTEVQGLWEAVKSKVVLDHSKAANYFSAQMVDETFGETDALRELLQQKERSAEENAELSRLEEARYAFVIEHSSEEIECMYERVAHKLRSLWGALLKCEEEAWIVDSAAQRQDFKNKIVFILKALKAMNDVDVPMPLAQFMKGMIFCPMGQKGALDTLTNTFLVVGQAGDARDFENSVKRLIAAQKEALAVYTFNPSGNSQSVHFLDFYKEKLDAVFGFSNFMPNPGNRTYGRDPFGGYEGNAAEAYLERLTPIWLAKVLVRHMQYYFDAQTKNNPLSLTDLLVWLRKNQKVRVVFSENNTYDIETYEGSEVYFDQKYTERTHKVTGALDYTQVRLTEEGALQLLVDIGVVTRKRGHPPELSEASKMLEVAVMEE